MEIRCRAQVTDQCHQLRGLDEEVIYGEEGQQDDGTWRRSDDTVVCTPCYIVLGMPELPYVETAIQAWKEAHAAQRAT